VSIEASLYIHIPFCSSFCDYCDFYSVKTRDPESDVMDLYIDALIQDIKYQIDYFKVKNIKTMYIGGGTPSVLGAKRISVLLEALSHYSKSCKEFTIEVNPESAAITEGEDFLRVCADTGITRISAGIQSFHEPSRFAVNRNGGIKKIEKSLEAIANLFPGSFSVDLITGLPLQTEKTVQEDIRRSLAYKPSHVSLYSLTLEEETPLWQKVKTGKITLPSQEVSDTLWLSACEKLKTAGYEHYEVSNFALPAKQCLHNLRYWNMQTWLGAGAASSGTIIKNDTATRYTYAADLKKYLASPSIHSAAREDLDKTSLIKETLLMGYRLAEGPDKSQFQSRFGHPIEHYIPKTLQNWKNRDITLFLNSFLSEAFLELDELLLE
jgi:oxygen-independent coproporphyrinogen-3 oxidase